MSSWKLFSNKTHNNSSQRLPKQNDRFSPKKISQNEQLRSKFHNITIDMDRLNHSRSSHQKVSHVGRGLVGNTLLIDQPRVIKMNSTQMKLQEERPRKSFLLSSGSFILNIPEESDSRVKINQNSFSQIEKTILIQRIQKIKQEFNNFQKIVFNELKKQQKLIYSMIQETIQQMNSLNENNKMSESSNYDMRNSQIQYMSRILQKNSGQNEFDTSEADKEKILNFIATRKKPDLKIQTNRTSSSNIQSSIHNEKLNSPSLTRFLNAMENLKKDIKGLNQISDLSSISSPRSETQKFTWQNTLRVNR